MRIGPALLCVLVPLLACSEPTQDPALELDPGKADEPADESDAAQRCGAPAEDEPTLYSDDLRWHQSLDEMAELYEQIYASGKRLPARAYYDANSESFILPNAEVWGGDVTLSARLIDSVSDHLELALEREYADFPFFSDMGHTHLFVPEEHWNQNYAHLSVPERALMYTRLFDDPELRLLYHTAEQLKQLDDDDQLLPDRYLQWRYFTRNIVGDNRGGKTIEVIKDLTQKANTARDLEGHHYIGAGFNVSASKDGCFAFTVRGETRYFDITLSDLEPDPNGEVDPFF